MKLSDHKGEDALDLIADIMEPVSKILQDGEFQVFFQPDGNMTVLEAAKILLKNHGSECLEILARVNNVPLEEFNPSVLELVKMIIEALNDPDLRELFTLQSRIEDAADSGSATENTEDAEM